MPVRGLLRCGALPLALGIALIAGCAGPQFVPLNRTALRASKPETLWVRTWPPPKFQGEAVRFILPLDVWLISKAIHGFGDVDDPSLRDPSILIGIDLGQAMAERFSLEVFSTKQVEEARRLAGGQPQGRAADLLLDLRTTAWGIVPTRIRHFGAKYSGTLQLVDLRTGTVLAQATCDHLPDDNPKNPTIDELKGQGVHRLKAMLRGAGEHCFNDFRTRVLGLWHQHVE